jgi:hypothetical protein
MGLLSMDTGNASHSRTPNPPGSVAEPGLRFDVLDLQAAVAASAEGGHRVVRLAGRVAGFVRDDVAVAGPLMGFRANPRGDLVG